MLGAALMLAAAPSGARPPKPLDPAAKMPPLKPAVIDEMSRNTFDDDDDTLLANTCMMPAFSATNQREASPGACFSGVGRVNDIDGNGSLIVMLAVEPPGGVGGTPPGESPPPDPPQAARLAAASTPMVFNSLVIVHTSERF